MYFSNADLIQKLGSIAGVAIVVAAVVFAIAVIKADPTSDVDMIVVSTVLNPAFPASHTILSVQLVPDSM